jgi:uncharacterized protein (DUF4415 family)
VRRGRKGRCTITKSRRAKGVAESGKGFDAGARYKRALTAKELAALADRDIDLSDIPELDADWFAKAEVRFSVPKEAVSIRLDADILDFFRTQGAGYQTRINAVLRAYMESTGK